MLNDASKASMLLIMSEAVRFGGETVLFEVTDSESASVIPGDVRKAGAGRRDMRSSGNPSL